MIAAILFPSDTAIQSCGCFVTIMLKSGGSRQMNMSLATDWLGFYFGEK